MNRSKNLSEIVKKLDISDTMRKNAEEKYKALAKELNELGINVEIYPQGSFALGTVVRPYTNGKEVEYDLDFICQEIGTKNDRSPKDVKKCIQEVLERHGRKVSEDNSCWIIDYANIAESLGFKIDIVPAVDEMFETKMRLVSQNVDFEYATHAIAITNTEDYEEYDWAASNAKGYTKWFNDINAPFLEKAVIEKSAEYKCSIENLPDIDKKSNLQRVIQILKRHRDIHFYRSQKRKPSSAIITTLVAEIAKGYNPNANLLELLGYITNNLSKSKLFVIDRSYFQADAILNKKDGKWYVSNPVNPENNLASDWDDAYAQSFFEWIDTLNNDLVLITEEDADKYYSAMKNSFGTEFIDSNLDNFKFIKKNQPNIINQISKPWKNDDRY